MLKKHKRSLQRSWTLCLGGDLMAAMTSEVCLAWFKFTELPLAKDTLSGPKPSVNTPVQKHMLHKVANTQSCVSHKLTYAPHRKYGVCSHSQPVVAIYDTAQVPQHTAQMRMSSECTSSSACNPCCAVQLAVSCQFTVLDPRWGTIPSFYFSYFTLKSVLGKPSELCCAPHN